MDLIRPFRDILIDLQRCYCIDFPKNNLKIMRRPQREKNMERNPWGISGSFKRERMDKNMTCPGRLGTFCFFAR